MAVETISFEVLMYDGSGAISKTPRLLSLMQRLIWISQGIALELDDAKASGVPWKPDVDRNTLLDGGIPREVDRWELRGRRDIAASNHDTLGTTVYLVDLRPGSVGVDLVVVAPLLFLALIVKLVTDQADRAHRREQRKQLVELVVEKVVAERAIDADVIALLQQLVSNFIANDPDLVFRVRLSTEGFEASAHASVVAENFIRQMARQNDATKASAERAGQLASQFEKKTAKKRTAKKKTAK